MRTENSQNTKEENKTSTSVSSYGGYQYKREYEELIQSKTAEESVPVKITVVVALAVLFTVSVVAIAVLLIVNVLLTAPKISVGATETENSSQAFGSDLHPNAITDRMGEVGRRSRAKIKASGAELAGFFITSDGYIVTASSPLLESGNITVNVLDKNMTAKLVGMDETSGVAVLKIDMQSLSAIDFGYNVNVRQGDSVYVVNDRGVIPGNISASGDKDFNIRGVAFDDSMLGSAVLDLNGMVVGIVTNGEGKDVRALLSSTVIPAIRRFVKDEFHMDISSECRYTDHLGITVVSVSDDESERFGLPGGIMVVKIAPSSKGEKIGLLTTDIIIGVDGVTISDVDSFESALSEQSGKSVTLLIYRNEKNVNINLDVDG